jgi:hypothetical protein
MHMLTYRFTNVKITDNQSQHNYSGPGTANATGGEDASSINEFFCKCGPDRPAITGRGDRGQPQYTIDATNASGLRFNFLARCTSRGNDPFVPGSTVCTFKAF